jgi:hypothetical protein
VKILHCTETWTLTPLFDQAVGSYCTDCATVALCMYQYKAKIQTEKECEPQAS